MLSHHTRRAVIGCMNDHALQWDEDDSLEFDDACVDLRDEDDNSTPTAAPGMLVIGNGEPVQE